MKKYNLSNIMKRAWNLVKEASFGISEALKKAWKEAKAMKELIGSEKQIKWANDIIKEATEIIEKFDLFKVKELFEENNRADWFIDNYAFLTKKRKTNADRYDFSKTMINKEFELRTIGMRRKEANKLGAEVFRPMYDTIEQYLD